MIKNRTIVEVEVNGRVFRLDCPQEGALEEVSQCLMIMQKYIAERLDDAKKPKPASEIIVTEDI
jgi:hypothetical protein